MLSDLGRGAAFVAVPVMASWPGKKSPRSIQVEAIERVERAFASGKKFVILEAPVGTGTASTPKAE